MDSPMLMSQSLGWVLVVARARGAGLFLLPVLLLYVFFDLQQPAGITLFLGILGRQARPARRRSRLARHGGDRVVEHRRIDGRIGRRLEAGAGALVFELLADFGFAAAQP